VGGNDGSVDYPDVYGDYLHAAWPGSGGYYRGIGDSGELGMPGGGRVRIRAAALELDDGSILANGGANAEETRVGFFIKAYAGTGYSGFSGDGGPAVDAQFSRPSGMAVDADGNLFITDSNNGRVRKVDTGGIITTVAGEGSVGYANPTGVATDSDGNLYIADNHGCHCIRKVDSAGITTAITSTLYGSYADGIPASEARLQYPVDVAVDAEGNLFISENGKNRIRKVDTNGIITTVAGGAGAYGDIGDDGPAVEAYLNGPMGIAVDGNGNLFIADQGNHRIRKVDADGIITTIAGNGSYYFGGDDGPALQSLRRRRGC
jgi:streptogramin lyase